MIWPIVSAIRLEYALEPENDTSLLPPNVYEESVSGPLTSQIRGSLYLPDKITAPTRLLVFSHGNHDVCEKSANSSTSLDVSWSFKDWQTCEKNGYVEVRSDLGFEYATEKFISRGYSVLVPSFNKNINGNKGLKYDPMIRAKLIIKTLKLLSSDISKQLGKNLTRLINTNEVGLMGHSRGGEACRVFSNIVHESLPDLKLKGIFELGPTDFGDTGIKYDPKNTPWVTMVGSCDNDVNQFSGVDVYERNEFTARKTAITIIGGNHNFFNSKWVKDDSEQDPRCVSGLKVKKGVLSIQQQTIASSFMQEFFDAVFQDKDIDLRRVKSDENVNLLILSKTNSSRLLYDGTSEIQVKNSRVLSLNQYFQSRLEQNYQLYNETATKIMLKLYRQLPPAFKIKYDAEHAKFNQNAKAIISPLGSSFTVTLKSPATTLELEYGERGICKEVECKIKPISWKIQFELQNGSKSLEKRLDNFGDIKNDGNHYLPYEYVKIDDTVFSVCYQRIFMNSISVPLSSFGVDSSLVQGMTFTVDKNESNSTMILGKIYTS